MKKIITILVLTFCAQSAMALTFEQQEAAKQMVRDGIKNSKAAYQNITGRSDNKKIKAILINMGFSKPEDQTIVLDVQASYRYLPELANKLADSKADVYQVSFNQQINNENETKREFRKCDLIVEQKEDRVNYTLSACLINTKNYVDAVASSDEMIISEDRDQSLLVTRQIHNLKFSENIH